MLEVLNMDYIRTARAKGLTERVVILKHALKNALIPVITVVGLQIGLLNHNRNARFPWLPLVNFAVR